MLAVTLSKDARARAVQLPAWNEALGLPRPWDQQWSLRAQQILAFETDLLEYGDLFHGSPVIESKQKELEEEAWTEIQEILERGGAVEAIESGYIKQKLVESNAARLGRIERGEQKVIGVNAFEQGEPSPLVADLDDAILVVDPAVEAQTIAALQSWKAERDEAAAQRALVELKRVAESDANLMPASIAAARAGVTTGEWAGALREVFGEFRAPTGVAASPALPEHGAAAKASDTVASLRSRLDELSETLGRRPKFLVGKPGLDGHSNGAEQIAIKARDVGFDVVYEGIRLTPERIAASALEEGVHLVGLSILSGSHLQLVPAVLDELAKLGAEIPVVVGGIIPEADAKALEARGVARVYTPKDFELNRIMSDLVELVAERGA